MSQGSVSSQIIGKRDYIFAIERALNEAKR